MLLSCFQRQGYVDAKQHRRNRYLNRYRPYLRKQNLQDCDYLVNYDIHWNPVRIIQRFGRIDRIGSRNARIQLVNFWPDMDLDEYHPLVKGMVDMAHDCWVNENAA